MKIGRKLASLVCVLLASLSVGCTVVPKPAAVGGHEVFGVKSVHRLFPFGDRSAPLEQDMLVEVRFVNRSTDILRLMSDKVPEWGGIVPPDGDVEFRTYFPPGVSELEFFVLDEQNRLLCTTWLYRNNHSAWARSRYERSLQMLLPNPIMPSTSSADGYPMSIPAGAWLEPRSNVFAPTTPGITPAMLPYAMPTGGGWYPYPPPRREPPVDRRRPTGPGGFGYNVNVGGSTNEGGQVRVHFGR